MPHHRVEARMKLPEQLPSDPDEIERLYNEYAQDVDDFDDAEFQRIMDARLAVWGIDPKQMTPDQIFGAMAESMNSMLLNLQAAMAEAPDDLAAEQVSEIIKAAEELRAQIDSAMQAAADKPVEESQPDGSSAQEIDTQS
jgi:predicted nuclease with TOPRIM domain